MKNTRRQWGGVVLCAVTLTFGFAGAKAGQVSADKACAMWAAFGHTAAEARDSGASEQNYNQKIDAMAASGDGFTRDNVRFAKGITRMVFHDFRKKSPGEIATLVHIGCLATN